MIIEPFRTDDIADFLSLAAQENWLAEEWEFNFLLSSFPQGCFAIRGDNGESVGFVTALCNDRSGWIGNLIVAERFRGRGLGEKLFTNALEALNAAGVETIWLTASQSGKSLYEKYGFNSIDTIIRWTGKGSRKRNGDNPVSNVEPLSDMLNNIDCLAWGDRRDALLAETIDRGRVIHSDSGFLIIQPCGDAEQFGPFTALESSTAEQIFNEALETVDAETTVYIDAPASNRNALRLFSKREMRISGSNSLMYAGSKPEYHAERLFGLATMGSCG